MHSVAILTICAVICCCCCCFSSSLVASSPATVSHFQISVCRGMCQFRADDLVFVFVFCLFFFSLCNAHVHKQARTHRRTNGEQPPVHASPACQHCKNSPYYPAGYIWFCRKRHQRSGFGKCHVWNRLIFNYDGSTADCLLLKKQKNKYILLFYYYFYHYSQHLIGAETA